MPSRAAPTRSPALLRLMDIVESTDSADRRRRMPRSSRASWSIPDFVATHAQTPEKLLMLVMHELHHVLLGHTTLFPRVTEVQNFVFDAVINGSSAGCFRRKSHTSLLHRLLRRGVVSAMPAAAPAGLAGHAQRSPAASRPCRSRYGNWRGDVHAALYSEAGATYQEVFDLLPKLLGEQRDRRHSAARRPRRRRRLPGATREPLADALRHRARHCRTMAPAAATRSAAARWPMCWRPTRFSAPARLRPAATSRT